MPEIEAVSCEVISNGLAVDLAANSKTPVLTTSIIIWPFPIVPAFQCRRHQPGCAQMYCQGGFMALLDLVIR